jgi:energy-coupling factor transporter ATP-binding protein EcfA2
VSERLPGQQTPPSEETEEGATGVADEQREEETPVARSGAEGGIAWNDRVLVLGYTGSGKSAFLDHLFGLFRVQRLLLDTKDEFSIAGVEPVRDVEAIDWRQPVIHYIDRTGEVAEYDELFEVCFTRRHLIVRVDELADVCEHQPNRTPRGFRKIANKGRAHGLGLLGASQRPYVIPTAARTEAQHVFIFGPRLDVEDHRSMAAAIGMRPDELGARIDALEQYAFLWWRRATRELVECPPLTDAMRASAGISRRTVA